MNYKDALISENNTIDDALRLLDRNGKKILFVIDSDGKLIAAVSDGDIRRHYIRGGNSNGTVHDVANYQPLFLYDSERGRAQTFMSDRHIEAVPIIDDNDRLIDIEFLFENMDISQIKIRELNKNDLDEINRFFDQMAGDTRSMFDRGDVNRIRINEHLKNNTPNEKHFAAFFSTPTGEQIVGYIFLWDTDKSVPWLGIAVHEKWKGKHMGRTLLKYLEDYACSEGYGGLMLTTAPANIRAQGLYTRMGFEFLGSHYSGEFLYIKTFSHK